MKKLVALLLCLVLVLSLCACGKSEPAAEDDPEPEVTDNADAQEEGMVGMQNPMTEYTSLDDVNKAVGGNLCGPAAMGVSDEAFFVIDGGSYKLGEYRFKMNGCEYCLRCAKTPEDISGVYLSGGEGTAFGEAAEDDGIQINSDDEYKCARWFAEDMQYILTVNDGGAIEQDTFESVASEFMAKTQGNM